MATFYAKSDIAVIRGIEAVRKRPAMYVGSADARGIQVMVEEVVGAAAFEGIRMAEMVIRVTINRDGSVVIADNGVGFPDSIKEEDGKVVPLAHHVLTDLFGSGGGRSPLGISLAVVNGLAESLVLESGTEGKGYRVRYQEGRIVSSWSCVGKAADSGTRVTFVPDRKIFGTASFEVPRILRYCRERARVQENVRFVVTDRTPTVATETSIECKEGMRQVVSELGLGLQMYPERSFHFESVLPVAEFQQPIVVSAALAFTRRSFARVHSFVNFAFATDGGTPVQGFQAAIDGAFDLARVPRGSRAGLRRGMIGAVHVLHPNPNWEGCTRSRVSSPELVGVVREGLMRRIAEWMEEWVGGGRSVGIGDVCEELRGGSWGARIHRLEGRRHRAVPSRMKRIPGLRA